MVETNDSAIAGTDRKQTLARLAEFLAKTLNSANHQ